MFKSVISSTPLVSPAANAFYKSIKGETFNDDVSFLTTLRALVYPRMSKDDELALFFNSVRFSPNEASDQDRVMSLIWNYSVFHNSTDGTAQIIDIQNVFSTAPNVAAAVMRTVERSFEEFHEGWHRMQKVTDFFRKTFDVLCFINAEQKRVFLLVSDLDIRKMHYLQCAIFAFLPWYFDPKAGVSELEMRLINSLRSKDSRAYEECIIEIAAQYDFRAQNIRSQLAGFETRYERLECDRTRKNIENIDAKIELTNRQLGDYFRKKAELQIRLLGLETKIQSESDDSEIMEYFLCNKKLSLTNVNEREMVFACMDYLTYFDEDMAKTYIDNPYSYVYQPNGYSVRDGNISVEDMKKLMYAIFIDQTLRIKFCAAYNFQLDGEVSALRNFSYGFEFDDCMPNPHTDRYSCIGNYRMAINALLKNHDYIGAIEQCVASCKSLNFADSVVMSEFMARLYGKSGWTNKRCIELPDKRVVTSVEAVKWLNAQEGSSESNE